MQFCVEQCKLRFIVLVRATGRNTLQSRDRCKVTLHCNTYCSALYCTEMQNVDRCTVKMHCDALKSGQVQPWSGRQRHRLGARDRPNSTNWRLPQIRLTPNRQILLSGFRQILNNWEANTLLPIDPLCPVQIYTYDRPTNIVSWQIFWKVSWNHEMSNRKIMAG